MRMRFHIPLRTLYPLSPQPGSAADPTAIACAMPAALCEAPSVALAVGLSYLRSAVIQWDQYGRPCGSSMCSSQRSDFNCCCSLTRPHQASSISAHRLRARALSRSALARRAVEWRTWLSAQHRGDVGGVCTTREGNGKVQAFRARRPRAAGGWQTAASSTVGHFQSQHMSAAQISALSSATLDVE